jgi:hypothetical protein
MPNESFPSRSGGSKPSAAFVVGDEFPKRVLGKKEIEKGEPEGDEGSVRAPLKVLQADHKLALQWKTNVLDAVKLQVLSTPELRACMIWLILEHSLEATSLMLGVTRL